MKDFTPLEVLDHTLKNWWVVVLLTLLGAMLGWLIHTQRPALYEARASFSINTDVIQTGSITQFEEDSAINTAGTLISSSSIREAVYTSAQQKELLTSWEDFPQVFIERRGHILDLRFRHHNPQAAAVIADLWVDEAYNQLSQAYQHAHAAHSYRNYLGSLENCLERSIAAGTSQTICNPSSLSELQNELQDTAAALDAELKASRGISTALVFAVSEHASVPTRPTLFGLNTFLLAGSLIGFLVGIWMLNLGFPRTSLKVSRYA